MSGVFESFFFLFDVFLNHCDRNYSFGCDFNILRCYRFKIELTFSSYPIRWPEFLQIYENDTSGDSNRVSAFEADTLQSIFAARLTFLNEPTPGIH